MEIYIIILFCTAGTHLKTYIGIFRAISHCLWSRGV